MRHVQYIIVMVFIGFTGSVAAQQLDMHRWQDRLVLVYTEDRSAELYRKQIDLLKKDMEGLEDRKLVIYHFTPGEVKKGLGSGEWEKRNGSAAKFFETQGKFEVLLLGLDGRVKLRQESLLTREKLYSTIDAMPMRQSELRNRGK